MKVIDTHFEEDSNALLELLKASITGEVILYRGAKCTVHIDPFYTSGDIELLEKQNPDCLVNSAKTASRDITLKKGFFHSKKYQFKVVNETYEMVVHTQTDGWRKVTMNIQSTNLQNTDNFSDEEWAKEHADLFVEKHNCTLF